MCGTFYVTTFFTFLPAYVFVISVDQNEECWVNLKLLRQCKNIIICHKCDGTSMHVADLFFFPM